METIDNLLKVLLAAYFVVMRLPSYQTNASPLTYELEPAKKLLNR